MRLVGIVLIVIGLVGVIWGGISWTQRESVANIGPLEITTEDRETLPIPPIVGAVCLIAGAIVLAGSRKR
jgi:drug/metabolite transporter (DMT)-like permease